MSISRRKFLGWIGVAGLTVTARRKAEAATTKHFGGYSDSLAILHDSVLCLGCRKCEESCNKINKLPKPEKSFADLSILNQKRRTTPKAYTVVNRYLFKNLSENGFGWLIRWSIIIRNSATIILNQPVLQCAL